MSWLRVDDKFPRHPKVLPLSDAAFRLHVVAMAYCAEHETDGRLSRAVVETLTTHRSKERIVDELVQAGVWERTDGGCEIHDYLDWNPSRAEQEAKRDAACARMNRVRSRHVRANTDRTSQEPVSTPSRPDPSPEEQEQTPSPARDAGATGTATARCDAKRLEAIWIRVVLEGHGTSTAPLDRFARACEAAAPSLGLEVHDLAEKLLVAFMQRRDSYDPTFRGGVGVDRVLQKFDDLQRIVAGLEPAVPERREKDKPKGHRRGVVPIPEGY